MLKSNAHILPSLSSQMLCRNQVVLFTPVGQYEKLRNRPLRLVNRKPQWVPID
jgi:hypothetical protein